MTRYGNAGPFLSVTFLSFLLFAVSLGVSEKETGTVEVSGEGTAAVLSDSGGGLHPVMSGGAASLPAGTYRVVSFVRTRMKPFARVTYTAPPGMTATVSPGKRTLIDFDPVLVAKVEVRKRRGRVLLSLEMATAQGARFRRFSGSPSSGDTAGIPFFITDGKGNVILEDSFHFG